MPVYPYSPGGIRAALLAVVATTWTSVAASAEDWPEFRGPTGQGVSTAHDVPINWSESSHVAWKRPIAGHGWSSPILVRGRLYLTTAVADEGADTLSLRTLCLAADSGETLWDVEAIAVPPDKIAGIHNKNSNASPTPLLHGGRLYVHFGHLGTACLALDGRVLWRNTELAYPPVHGNGGSPVVAGKGLVFSCDGGSDPFVAALELERGELLWRTARPGENLPKTFSFCTPLLIDVAGRPQVISPGAGSVSALAPATGEEIWRVNYDGYSVIPRPVFGHGLIFLSTGYDAPKILAIRVDGRGDVTDTHVAWTLARGAPNTPSLLLVGSELYAVSDRGVASCIDAQSGTVHWQERVGGNYSSSPVYADGKIYLQSEDGLGIVLRAGQQFEKLAENQLDARTLASYALDDGVIFIRADESLYRIEAE